jgi:FkbM family methyltransferase
MRRDSLPVKILELYGTRIRHRGQWRIHSLLRKVFKISINAECAVVRAGLKWHLNPSNYVESDLFWLDIKDVWEIYHIKELLDPGSVVFDIGANFGFYSCMIAKILGEECTVHSFEPLAYSFQRLKTNISINDFEGCIQSHKFGVSDKKGKAAMEHKAGNSGAAHIIEDRGDIDITTVDEFCDELKIDKIDFMKIDVEGFELRVLLGAEKMMRHSMPSVLIEINPPTLKRYGLKPLDVINKLTDYGYNMYVAKREKLERLANLPDGEDYIDVFCIHPNRAAIGRTTN